MGLESALALGGLSAGGSIISALLGRKKTKGKQTTQETFSPEQEALRGDLARLLQERLQDPSLGIDEQPIRNRLRSQTNRTSINLGQRLEAANARRGFGRGGATGSQLRKLDIARGEQFGDIESRLQEYLQNLKLQERNRATDQALLFSSRPTGSTTTQEGTVSGNLGQGIEQGSTGLAFLIAMSKLMGGGTGGGNTAPTTNVATPSFGHVTLGQP